MLTTLCTIYGQSSTPFVRRFPTGGVMLITGEPDPFSNFAIGLSSDELAVAARHLIETPAPSMVMIPGERFSALEKVAETAGFVHSGVVPAMTASLDPLPEVEMHPDYVFERLVSPEGGPEWAKVFVKGYPVTPLAADSMSPVHVPLDVSAGAQIQYFQIRQGSELAGVSMLVLADGLAGIYCVATLPGHRRKGLGAALTAMPLVIARDLGYKSGVLQASKSGYSVYQRLGFEETGAVQLYMHTPEGMTAEH